MISCDSRVDSAATATDAVTDMLRIEGWGVNHKRVERDLEAGGAEGPAAAAEALSANVRETRSTQRIRVGRRQRNGPCWDCERE